MQQRSSTIARNTSWFTVALIVQKIIAFVYFTYLARVLGAQDLGMYTFALSYISIFSIVIDFGTNHYITREIAKDRAQAQTILSHVLGFKLCSAVVAGVLAFGFMILLGYSGVQLQLLLIALGVMVVESFVLSIFALIRGFQTLRYESIITVVVHTCIAVGGMVVVQITDVTSWLLVVLLGGHLLNLSYGTYLLRTKFNLAITAVFDVVHWKKIALIVLPFALAAGFSKIYGAFDQIMLSKMASPSQLGFYAVANKLTFALQFVPMALMASLYPAMSQHYRDNHALLQRVFTQGLFYLLVITLPIAGIVVSFAPVLIEQLYTESFLPAVLPLQILIMSLPFLFVNFPIGSLLNAADNQKQQTKNIGIALLCNIVLNVLLVPQYQAVGAAMASSISTVVFFVLGWMSVRRIITVSQSFLLRLLAKIAGSVVMMVSIGLWLYLQGVHWVVAIMASGVVYIGALFALRVVSRGHVQHIMNSLIKRT